jgi:hypothetical protein
LFEHGQFRFFYYPNLGGAFFLCDVFFGRSFPLFCDDEWLFFNPITPVTAGTLPDFFWLHLCPIKKNGFYIFSKNVETKPFVFRE